MRKKGKTPDVSRFVSETTYHGHGLFPTVQGVEAAERTFQTISKLHPVRCSTREWKNFRNEIAGIASEYFSDKEFFSVRPPQVKNDLLTIGKLTSTLADDLQALPKRSKETLNQQVARSKIGASRNCVAELVKLCELVRPICASIAPLAGKRTRMEPVPKCCSALKKLWEKSTGKKFARSAASVGTGEKRSFTTPGVHLVHMLMRDIDPNVTAKQIATWVKKPKKKVSRKKQSQKAGAKSA